MKVGENRMRVGSIYVHFVKEIEGDMVFCDRKVFDLFISAGLLGAKLVAWKGEDAKALVSVGGIQFLKLTVIAVR